MCVEEAFLLTFQPELNAKNGCDARVEDQRERGEDVECVRVGGGGKSAENEEVINGQDAKKKTFASTLHTHIHTSPILWRAAKSMLKISPEKAKKPGEDKSRLLSKGPILTTVRNWIYIYIHIL